MKLFILSCLLFASALAQTDPMAAGGGGGMPPMPPMPHPVPKCENQLQMACVNSVDGQGRRCVWVPFPKNECQDGGPNMAYPGQGFPMPGMGMQVGPVPQMPGAPVVLPPAQMLPPMFVGTDYEGYKYPDFGDFYKFGPAFYSQAQNLIPQAQTFVSSLACGSAAAPLDCSAKRDMYGNLCLWNGFACTEAYRQIESKGAKGVYCAMQQSQSTCMMTGCFWLGSVCMDKDMMEKGGSMFFLPPQMAASSLPIGGAPAAEVDTPAGFEGTSVTTSVDSADAAATGDGGAAGTGGIMELQKISSLQKPAETGSDNNDAAKHRLFKILMFICIPIAVSIGSILAANKHHKNLKSRHQEVLLPIPSGDYAPIILDDIPTPEQVVAEV